MQPPIRVSIFAEKDEDSRKLIRLFKQFPGFAVVNSFANAEFGPGTFDVRVVHGANVAQLAVLAPACVPTLYLVSSGSVQADEFPAPNAVLPLDAPTTQVRAAAMAVAAGLQIARKHAFNVADKESELTFSEPLTDRELHILNLVADGHSNPEIARRLKISRNMVKFHVSSIISKLGATSRTEAVTIGIKHGLIII